MDPARMLKESLTSRPELENSLGQTRTSSLGAARPLPPSADIGPGGQSIDQAAQFCFSATPPRAPGAPHR
jgi:hypothetical protein